MRDSIGPAHHLSAVRRLSELRFDATSDLEILGVSFEAMNS
jgi:hypothetical protein